VVDDRLTPDQSRALADLLGWLHSPPGADPFLLQGCAGTGKTHLSMRFLQEVEQAGLCWTVAAPTHKAVGVLRQALDAGGLHAPWYPSTLHRLLRLRLRRRHGREVCEASAETGAALEHLDLVLIDEASMIDAALLDTILGAAARFPTRLVFVGDPAQLPPIDAARSPVFDQLRGHGARLGAVVRHQGPVLRLATAIREGLWPLRTPPCLPTVREALGEVGVLSRDRWLAAALAALRRASDLDDPDAARVLCYTNRSVDRLMPLVRLAVHGQDADRLAALPGEVLISRAAVTVAAGESAAAGGEEADLVLASNREVLVREVRRECCDLRAFGVAVAAAGADPQELAIETLRARVDAGAASLDLRLLPPVGSEARHRLDALLARLRSRAVAAGGEEARDAWRDFFRVRDAFAALGPASLLTVHRSQGSSFGEVFLERDLLRPSDAALRRQLLYVAVTRARRGVWLQGRVGDPEEVRRWSRILAAAVSPPGVLPHPASPDSRPARG
jgi:exodeoxyribonuclease-5